jgi:hypothetical protein
MSKYFKIENNQINANNCLKKKQKTTLFLPKQNEKFIRRKKILFNNSDSVAQR